MENTITVIPPTEQAAAPALRAKTRVAVYARVSTSSAEQLNSIEAQKSYYAAYVSARPDWVLVDIYADEGISGTSYRNRQNFNRMIDDARSHKIDLIITKSVSRFARNTVDTLTNIRQLKQLGVAIYFERENINTLDVKGEFLITLLSSMAQEESRSLSENVTWGIRKRMQKGQYQLGYSQFLGYRKGKQRSLDIVPEEAITIRLIYYLAIVGLTTRKIADYLTKHGYATPGRKGAWWENTVLRILQNEKYCGDALLQKTFIADFLTKETRKNTGQLPKYYLKNDHDAIISPVVWHYIQEVLTSRNRSYSSIGLSAFLRCGACGGNYCKVIRRSSRTEPVSFYRCKNKYNKSQKCGNPIIYEAQTYQLIEDCFFQRLSDYTEVIPTLRRVIQNTLQDEERTRHIFEVLRDKPNHASHIDLKTVRITVRRATITPARTMIVEMIDEKAATVPIPYWSPVYYAGLQGRRSR